MYVHIILIFVIIISFAIRSRTNVKQYTHSLPMVSSFIPWIGTAVELFHDTVGFLRKSRELYGSMYVMAVVGRQVFVTCHKEGLTRVLRAAPRYLTNDFNSRMLEAVGGVTNGSITHHVFAKLSGVVLKSFSNRAIPKLSPAFTERIVHETTSFLEHETGQRIPFSTFVGGSIYKAVSYTLWGPNFPCDTYSDFKCIDFQLPLLVSPTFFTPSRAVEARNRLKSQLGEFLRENWSDVYGISDASPAANDIITTLRKANLSPSDQDGVLLAFLLGLHANTLRVSNWFLAYLLSHPVAFQNIREEIDTVIDTQYGSLSALLAAPVSSLGKDAFPLLNSALKETMRLSVAPVFMREVKSDINFSFDDGTTVALKQGQYVVADGCALNMAQDVFAEPTRFKYDRFAHFEDITAESSMVSPFGSGIHACKGQDFAVYEMKIFMIVCMRLFNITGETSTGDSLQDVSPKASTLTPTPVMYLEDGIYVRLNKRDVHNL